MKLLPKKMERIVELIFLEQWLSINLTEISKKHYGPHENINLLKQ